MAWLQELGFSENPFYLYPIPANKDAIRLGFIDRQKELDNIDSFVQLKRGKILLLGRRGEGKSSLLNVLEYKSKQLGKIVLRVDIQKARTKLEFLEALLREVQHKMSAIPKSEQKALDERLENLNVIKRKKEKKLKGAAEIEGKIGALIASIKGKISAEETDGEEIEYYVAPRVQKLEGIFNYILPVLFASFEGALVCDNLEKIGKKNFETFLTEIVQTLPDNILFVVTGNLMKIDSALLKKCYDVFDLPLMMEEIDTASELRAFIDGRLKAYSIDEIPKIAFDSEAIEILLDRTEGNLRECFRYCFFALQRFKKDISKSLIEKAILNIDKPKFEILDDLDRKILSTLSALGEASLKRISEEILDASESTLKNRLANLVSCEMVRRRSEKKGRAHRFVFRIPKTLQLYFANLS